jgi:hypothetical protein
MAQAMVFPLLFKQKYFEIKYDKKIADCGMKRIADCGFRIAE